MYTITKNHPQTDKKTFLKTVLFKSASPVKATHKGKMVTSLKAFLSSILEFWSVRMTFLDPSATADSILRWCRSSSIRNSSGDKISHRAPESGPQTNGISH